MPQFLAAGSAPRLPLRSPGIWGLAGWPEALGAILFLPQHWGWKYLADSKPVPDHANPSPVWRLPEPDSTNLRGESLAGKDRQTNGSGRWGLPVGSHRELHGSSRGSSRVCCTICTSGLDRDCLLFSIAVPLASLAPDF